MNRSVDVSHKTIIFIATFIGALWVIFQIKEVILILFVAIILMSALSPVVDVLTKRHVPKGIAIALSYLLILGFVGLLVYLIITPLQTETARLISHLPQTFDKIAPDFGFDQALVQKEIADFSTKAVGFTLTIFSNILTLISVAVLTFYLLVDRERLYKLIVSVSKDKERTTNLLLKIESKLGGWMRGQIVLSLVIGGLSYTLLFLLGVPYALPLAILAGIMEVIPVIGPIISAIPAVFVAYLSSPALALIVGIGYFGIQQAENHFVVPQVMKRAVGLNPLIVILAIAIGGKLLGVAGGLLAVPITVVIQIILEDYLNLDLEDYSEEKKP